MLPTTISFGDLGRVFDCGVQETVPIFFFLLYFLFVLPPAPGDRCDDTVSFGFACGRELFWLFAIPQSVGVFACRPYCPFASRICKLGCVLEYTSFPRLIEGVRLGKLSPITTLKIQDLFIL